MSWTWLVLGAWGLVSGSGLSPCVMPPHLFSPIFPRVSCASYPWHYLAPSPPLPPSRRSISPQCPAFPCPLFYIAFVKNENISNMLAPHHCLERQMTYVPLKFSKCACLDCFRLNPDCTRSNFCFSIKFQKYCTRGRNNSLLYLHVLWRHSSAGNAPGIVLQGLLLVLPFLISLFPIECATRSRAHEQIGRCKSDERSGNFLRNSRRAISTTKEQYLIWRIFLENVVFKSSATDGPNQRFFHDVVDLTSIFYGASLDHMCVHLRQQSFSFPRSNVLCI